jgi:hypothetical protein
MITITGVSSVKYAEGSVMTLLKNREKLRQTALLRAINQHTFLEE